MNRELTALLSKFQSHGPDLADALKALERQRRALAAAREKIIGPGFASSPTEALWRQEVRARFRELNITGAGDSLIQSADEVTCRALLETPHWLAGLGAGQVSAIQSRLLALNPDEVNRLDNLEADLNTIAETARGITE